MTVESRTLTGNFVKRSGDTMTGDLTLPSGGSILTSAGVLNLDPVGNIEIESTMVVQGNNIANVNSLDGVNALMTQFYDLVEWGIPTAPAPDRGRLYVIDDGGGNTQLIARFNTGAAVVLATQNAREVNKAADELVNNSVTLQNDDDLVLPVRASSRYWLEAFLLYEATAVADWKRAFTLPAAATMKAQEQNGGTWSANMDPTTATSFDGAGAGVQLHHYIRAFIITGANAGNVQLQFAQQTAEVSDTKMLAGSFMRMWKV